MRKSPHFQFRFSLETASYLPYHSQLASFLVRILRRASLDQSSDIMAGSFRSLSSSWIILMAASFHVSSSHAFVPSAIPSPGNRRHHSPSSLTALSQKDAIRSTTAPLISINPDHDDDDDNDNLLLTRFQKTASAIVSSYQPTIYDPWITNCHVQTIGAFFLRGSTPAAYAPRHETVLARMRRLVASVAQQMSGADDTKRRTFWDVRERIDTTDGDWFHADTKYYYKHPQPTTSATLQKDPPPPRRVIIVHGLESNSNSSLVQEIAQACGELGMNVTCLNFRSCSVCAETEECLLNDNLGACKY